MDFRTEFNANQGIVCISTEFVMEFFAGSDDDCLEEITGHEYDDQVADADVGSGVECRVLHHRLGIDAGGAEGRAGPRGLTGFDNVGHCVSRVSGIWSADWICDTRRYACFGFDRNSWVGAIR